MCLLRRLFLRCMLSNEMPSRALVKPWFLDRSLTSIIAVAGSVQVLVGPRDGVDGPGRGARARHSSTRKEFKNSSLLSVFIRRSMSNGIASRLDMRARTRRSV